MRHIVDLHHSAVNGRRPSMIEYPFGRLSVRMPASHQLANYQRNHKLYDRFLPHLAKYLSTEGLVIDVGANCGDTLAAMFSANSDLAFVCVEPDDEFFQMLQETKERILAIDPSVSIRLVKELIGESVKNVSLEGSKGTKKAVSGSSGSMTMDSMPLDKAIDSAEGQKLVLLKSDVDGYDYDVIDSAERLVTMHRPLLFFECQQDHDFQRAGYVQTITRLFDSGYDQWVVFDNFGEVVLRTERVSDIVQLFDYVWRQNMKRSSRTIYYFDVLASTEQHRLTIGRCIDDYLAIA